MKRQGLFLAAVFALTLAVGLSVGLLLFSQAGPATAQPVPAFASVDDDYRISSIEGIVWRIDDTGDLPVWELDVYVIHILSSTVVITNGLAAEEGVYARIEFEKAPPELEKALPEGMIATKVELQNVPATALFDQIRTMDGEALWMVGNTNIEIGADTLVPDVVEVGDFALVEGFRSQVGITATRIEILSTENPVLFDGIIKSIRGNVWRVGDIAVVAPPPDHVHGNVIIGSRVKVYGAQIGPNRVGASEIWVMNNIGRHSLTGWLLGIRGMDYPYLWQVNLLDGYEFRPIAVLVEADTVIDASQAPVEPRAWLDMETIGESESLYRAESITVTTHPPKRQFFGVIEEMPAQGTLGQWIISGYAVLVTEQSSITGTPVEGAGVWVAVQVSHDGMLIVELMDVLG